MRTERGIILIILLIFLELFALISLYELGIINLMHKIDNQSWRIQQTRVMAETLLHKIELNFNQEPYRCVIADIPAQLIAEQTLSWWQEKSCAGNFQSFRYYYVVENLGNDPCGYVTENQSTDYYRISVLTIPVRNRGVAVLLQSTWAVESAIPLNCSEFLHSITQGRQMWRELTTNLDKDESR